MISQKFHLIFTHAPCGSVGLHMDFLSFSFTPINFVFLLGTENIVGGGHVSFTEYAILFKMKLKLKTWLHLIFKMKLKLKPLLHSK